MLFSGTSLRRRSHSSSVVRGVGVVGIATFGLGTALLGGGVAATVGVGAASGVIAGQVGHATNNAFNGREVTEGLFEPGQIGRY